MVEESKRKKIERLQHFKEVLQSKKAVAADFKERYDIDFDILFDPWHERFNELYALEEETQENLVMAVKLQSASRQGMIMFGFLGYHLVKSVLWRYGYFAKFFYRQRFLSFPIVLGAVYWNLRHTMSNMQEAGVLDYNRRRTRLDRDSKLVEKILKSRLDLAKERQAAVETTTSIKKLID